jgi:phosphoadenosine phosphosulfate reductase
MTNEHRTAVVGEESSPEAIVAWALDRFAGREMVVTTSFGMEGCALIDMVARHGGALPVVYLDTMFLFPETYRLRDRMMKRYPRLRFENRGTTLTPEAQAAEHGPELWRRDPDACCGLRKVEPMRRALAGVDVWMSAVMRSQTAERAALRVVEWDWQHHLLKLSPLAGWDRQRVWDYVREHDVPYNELHERGYPTLGCVQCTRPVAGLSPGQYSRRGRWADSDKTECGLHLGTHEYLARKA